MSSLPLFPSDDGWPYPDLGTSAYIASELGSFEPTVDDDVDLDLLELRVDPHAYADLTELEYFAVSWRYGVGGTGTPHSMKDLARRARLQPRRGVGGARRCTRQAAPASAHRMSALRR